MNFQKSNKEMPKKDGRGRPCVYNLHLMKIGEGKEIAVRTEKAMDSLRGKLFASASHFGVKITTEYNVRRCTQYLTIEVNMSNFRRYNLSFEVGDGVMINSVTGEYVKFDEIKELLNTAHNISVMPCRMHDCGEGCFLEFKSKSCGRYACQLSARA